MTDRLSAVLFNPQQARQPFEQAWNLAKSLLMAGHRLTLELKPEKRTLSQNAKFHAICRDFERSGQKFAGKPRTEDEWKVLLISGHATATGKGAEVIAGLEGEFVNVRESSAAMVKSRGSSLIDYCIATASLRGIPLTEYESKFRAQNGVELSQ